ncbi:MAG: hypothetical protein DMG49_15910 [Acidobacteria bacterium]|nr:MAG: hypothetical protein DMG49_15910 [Acidobacteriota bacterium]
MTIPPPSPPGSTKVIVLLTSTANDKLVAFDSGITSIALTDKAGTRTDSASGVLRPVTTECHFRV